MANELRERAKKIQKTWEKTSCAKSDALPFVQKLIIPMLAHCDVTENLDQSPERIELYSAVCRALRSRVDASTLRLNRHWNLFRGHQDYSRLGPDRLIDKWIRCERYAPAVYALLEIVVEDTERLVRIWTDWENRAKKPRSLRVEKKTLDHWETTSHQVSRHVGRHLMQVLVAAGALESALALYHEDSVLGHHAPTAAALLQQAIKERRLKDVCALRQTLAGAEPNHSLLAQADEAIIRLKTYKQLRAQSRLAAEDIDQLTGAEFERLIADQFIALGYAAECVGRNGDYGADVKVITADGTVVLVQCKRYNRKVNLKAVQEVLGSIGHYGGEFGIVITNNGFLGSALKLAQSNDIELWGSERLARFLTGDITFSELKAL